MNFPQSIPTEDEEKEDKDGEKGESFEDLRDNEYEENLNEYGDGNETDDWPSGGKADADEEAE